MNKPTPVPDLGRSALHTPLASALRIAAGIALGSLSARADAPPPEIKSVEVAKSIFNVQTDAGVVEFISYAFTASVEPKPRYEGDTFSGLPAPTVTFPAGAGATSLPGHSGTLGFKNDRWNYGAPVFDYWGAATSAELDTLFPDGSYGFTVFGTSISLNLTAAYSFSAPVYTLTGGTWSGGQYLIDVNQTLTVTSSAFTDFSANQNGFIQYQLKGPGGVVSKYGYTYVSNPLISSNTSTDNSFTYTLNPGTLAAGTEYKFYGFFATQVDSVVGADALAGSLNIAYAEQATGFRLLAVPEPSTYAALIGACAVAFAACRKRRGAGSA